MTALPCGCPIPIDPDHSSGERGIVCGGSATCPSGRGYIVTARPRTTVELTVRPMPAHMLKRTPAEVVS